MCRCMVTGRSLLKMYQKYCGRMILRNFFNRFIHEELSRGNCTKPSRSDIVLLDQLAIKGKFLLLHYIIKLYRTCEL